MKEQRFKVSSLEDLLEEGYSPTFIINEISQEMSTAANDDFQVHMMDTFDLPESLDDNFVDYGHSSGLTDEEMLVELDQYLPKYLIDYYIRNIRDFE